MKMGNEMNHIMSHLSQGDMAIAYRGLIKKKKAVVQKLRARIEKDQLVLLVTEADLSRLEAAYRECVTNGTAAPKDSI